MRTWIRVMFLSGAICAGTAAGALAQPASGPAAPPDPTTTATTPTPAAAPASRSRPAVQGGQPGGVYARPGRCRELAIGRKLSGLARQRFIKRCRIARRSMPRPVLTGPGITTAPAPAAVPAPAAPAAAPSQGRPAGQP